MMSFLTCILHISLCHRHHQGSQWRNAVTTSITFLHCSWHYWQSFHGIKYQGGEWVRRRHFVPCLSLTGKCQWAVQIKHISTFHWASTWWRSRGLITADLWTIGSARTCRPLAIEKLAVCCHFVIALDCASLPYISQDWSLRVLDPPVNHPKYKNMLKSQAIEMVSVCHVTRMGLTVYQSSTNIMADHFDLPEI